MKRFRLLHKQIEKESSIYIQKRIKNESASNLRKNEKSNLPKWKENCDSCRTIVCRVHSILLCNNCLKKLQIFIHYKKYKCRKLIMNICSNYSFLESYSHNFLILLLILLSFSFLGYVIWLLEEDAFNSQLNQKKVIFSPKICNVFKK